MALMTPFSAITSRANSLAQSAGRTVGAYATIGILGLLGAGFLVAALYIWLAANTDPLAASLLMGTGFLAIAGISLAIVAANANRKERERKQSAADAAVMASTVSLAATGLKLASRVKGPLLIPALAAIAAGWYFGRSSGEDDT